MAICQRCEKIFRRVPFHPRKFGVLIQSRAKLCPACRKAALKGRPRKSKH